MLSSEELETIREQVEYGSDNPIDLIEVAHMLLWHIDALEAREKPAPKLPEGARTLPDGSIRLGVPRRYLSNRKAAKTALDRVKAKRSERDD